MALAQRQGGNVAGEVLLEGSKIILEALQSGWTPSSLILGSDEPRDLDRILSESPPEVMLRKATSSEMERISRMKSAPHMMASFRIPERIPVKTPLYLEKITNGQQRPPWWLVADRIQDPGNLGTMIRIADWFGFEGIICSPDTVNCYNSKVIQASMGSLFRVPVHYAEINPMELSRLSGIRVPGLQRSGPTRDAGGISDQRPWLVAAMPGGLDINQIQFPAQGGLLLIGNESHGLSPDVLQYSTHRLGIPSFGMAESLNAAVATGIFASAIRRSEAHGSDEIKKS